MNKDLLKVIAGLECCVDSKSRGCDVCPYDDGKLFNSKCLEALLTGALEILREVERDGLLG